MLLQWNVDVSIRLNVTESNGEELLKLVDELNIVFGARSGLRVYCRAIFEDAHPRSEEENEAIYKYVRKIEDKLYEYEFDIGQSCREYITIRQCMADDGLSVLIDPFGNIGTCEHHVSSDFFGNIETSKIEPIILEQWGEYMEDIEICKDCPVYGECLRPKKCIELRHCDKVIKSYRIKQYTDGLRSLYLDYRMKNMLPSPLIL
jgi:radical SAM protein with 4Fe4S-binding SPASM domain